MTKVDTTEADISNEYIELINCSGQHLTAYMVTGSVEEKIKKKDYFEAFKSITSIYSIFNTLNTFTGEEKNRVQKLRDKLDVQVVNALSGKAIAT
jgi:hypothetical protein